MGVQKLNTRIALKYDSFENWQKSNLVLLPGEVAICEIGGGVQELKDAAGKVIERVQTAPTVLFKVGSADKKAFKDLPWASAKAADVYDWAKKPEAEFLAWLSSTAAFATDAEVEALLQPISAAIADIENSLNGNADGGIGKAVDALGERLDVIEGTDTVEGSVAKALKDAKKYTDDREVEIKKYADQAETDANTYADGKVKALADGAVAQNAADILAHTSAKNNPHEVTKTQVGLGNVDNKSVATIKTEFTGAVAANNGNFATGGAVYTAIESAKTAAAETAQGKVNALANGQVATNKQDIADLLAALAEEKEDRADGDNGLDTRLKKVEAFFGSTKEHEGYTGLDKALDTLVEIQEYLSGDGTAADGLLGAVNENATDIAALEREVFGLEENKAEGITAYTGLVDRVAANSGDISNLKTVAVPELQNTLTGYSSTSTVKSAIEAVSVRAEKGVTDADGARQKAEDAQGRVGVVEGVLNGTDNNGLIATANAASASITAHLADKANPHGVTKTQVGLGNVDNKSVATIKSEFTGAVADGSTGFATGGAVHTAIATAKAAAIGEVTALANGRVAAAEGAIAGIQADYVSYSANNLMAGEDIIIFNCGGASDTIIPSTTN